MCVCLMKEDLLAWLTRQELGNLGLPTEPVLFGNACTDIHRGASWVIKNQDQPSYP